MLLKSKLLEKLPPVAANRGLKSVFCNNFFSCMTSYSYRLYILVDAMLFHSLLKYMKPPSLISDLASWCFLGALSGTDTKAHQWFLAKVFPLSCNSFPTLKGYNCCHASLLFALWLLHWCCLMLSVTLSSKKFNFKGTMSLLSSSADTMSLSCSWQSATRIFVNFAGKQSTFLMSPISIHPLAIKVIIST